MMKIIFIRTLVEPSEDFPIFCRSGRYSFDNVLAETTVGLYKAEVIERRGAWRRFEDVEMATLEWVDWFNNRRLLGPIRNIPPVEAEVAFNTQLAGEKIAA